ncbi:hypothetical protein IDJ75_03460 [Mucilaginibacter rigui]|uniref:Uncharacterized protein n=1 Tax=Mucilaginibacter rigui TaxID=534635 RepID=A0ABR7X151_9SPHI|nr:hypothetical protein [Mucilaginibacter rigui]MBD1384322.1 hypothetical protein [Mucilaginibacter rigui]
MKEQQPAGVLWESNPTVYTVSPDEVLPAYGIFHYVYKKGQKATGVFFC